RKFVRSHFGALRVEGLPDQPAEEDFVGSAQMRNFRGGPASPGWSGLWRIEDRYQYLPPGRKVHLRYIDLTSGAEGYTGESWISVAGFDRTEEAWIPHLMVRRKGSSAPLASTFVAVIEPFEGTGAIATARRWALTTPEGQTCPEASVGVEIVFRDGRRDLLCLPDRENPLALGPMPAAGKPFAEPRCGLAADGDLALVRFDGQGRVSRAAMAKGRRLSVAGIELTAGPGDDFVEAEY
ncbi:MAG: hypothetical protein HRF43_20205, partial [Phycisphaerae bacterium]